MRSKAIILAVMLLLACCLVGCGATAASDDELQIVTTIFPEYDWVKNILGEDPAHAELTMLIDSGTDLHSYQPTAADILKISNCDLFIYVGGESDEWVEDALKEAVNKDMIVISLLDMLGDSVKEEELVEGMQASEHEHEHEEGEEHDHEEGPEYDEHVWLSLKNSAVLVDAIEKQLEKADPSNAKTYKANAAAYIEKINALDAQYSKAVSEGKTNTLLFGDRFPFRYMTDDYGLDYYAAFVGCSAESEASFETITFLAKKVDELSLKSVLTIESSDKKIANTIIQNTVSKDQKVLTMNSLQSVTAADLKDGISYLTVMEENLEVLKEALK